MKLRRIILVVFAMLTCIASLAAQMATVTSTKFSDASGARVTGVLTWQPVLANGTPASFRIGSGGTVVSSPVSVYVSNGAFTLAIADTSVTSPLNVCFRLSLATKLSSAALGPGYGCVQPASNNSWCSAGVCNLDNYVPSLPALAIIQTGPPGAAATIAIGTVSTGAPGTAGAVYNAGTSSNALLNFTLPQGPQGVQGNTGATGQAATVGVGAVNTLAPGSSATVTNTGTSGAAVLAFGIPQGATGATGQAATVGVGAVNTLAPGSSATVTNTGTSGAAVLAFGIPQGATGATGATGPAPNLSIGTVGTLPAGNSATASVGGANPNYTLNLGLPTGATGATGPAPNLAIGTVNTLPVGNSATASVGGSNPNYTLNIGLPTGATGATGATGPAPNLAIGTVSTLSPGSNATASVSGANPNYAINIGIPQGATGATGATGAQGPTGTVGVVTPYSSSATYGIGQVVYCAACASNGSSYASLTAGNTGTDPSTSPSNWQIIAQSASFTGSFSGDVTGGQNTTTVSKLENIALPALSGATGVLYHTAGAMSVTNAPPLSAVNMTGLPVTSFNGRTGAIVPAIGDYTASMIGLGNITNFAQALASIYPNTVPAAGQIAIGNAGGTAYAPQTLTGDCAVSYAGAITCTKSNGVALTSLFQAAGSYSPLAGSLNIVTVGTLTAGSVPYSLLSGTPPTWNQNTTGTAAGLSTTLSASSGGTGVAGTITGIDYANGTSAHTQATGHQINAPYTCTTAGTTTAYTCSTSPSFTPAAQDRVQLLVNAANTGSATLAVNGAAAKTLMKQGGSTALVANDLLANHVISAIYDGTYWQLEGQLGNTASSGITSVGLSVPNALAVTGSPLTANGTLALAWANNTFLSLGYGAGLSAPNDVAVGYKTLKADTGGSNTAVGYQAATALTTSSNNVAIGYDAMDTATTQETGSVAIGYYAMQAATGGSDTALGYYALAADTGGFNTAVGYQAMKANVYSLGSVAVGYAALQNSSQGGGDVAVGYMALENDNAGNNTAVGYTALYYNTLGTNDTAVGDDTMGQVTASNDTAVGAMALYGDTGGNNTAVGYQAQRSISTGSNNTAVGYYAMKGATSDTYSTAIGEYAVLLSNAGDTYENVIGAGVTGNGSYTSTLGGTNQAYAVINGGYGSSVAATVAAAAGAGTSPTIACAASHTCSASEGTVSLTTSTATAAGALLTITAAAAHAKYPNCTASIVLAASPYTASTNYLFTYSTSVWTLNVGTALTASTAYTITYSCPGY